MTFLIPLLLEIKSATPVKKNSPTGNMQWELRTFEKGNLWAISALTIVDGDFVLNKPSNIKDAFGNYNWVTEKNPNFQKMAKSRQISLNFYGW